VSVVRVPIVVSRSIPGFAPLALQLPGIQRAADSMEDKGRGLRDPLVHIALGEIAVAGGGCKGVIAVGR
jgi:hypothetical protein